MKGVMLLSGGLDSCVALDCAARVYDETICLWVDYGQTNLHEAAAAEAIARHYGQPFTRARVYLDEYVTPLTGLPPEAPRTLEEIRREGRSPWFVPARNTILLGQALAVAELRGAGHIAIGATQEDHLGFPDCRPEFLQAFARVASLSAGREIDVVAPLGGLRKVAALRLGLSFGAPLDYTTSCYFGRACGRCDACMLRAEAFEELGVQDPCSSTPP